MQKAGINEEFKKIDFLILIIIIFAALVLRLYKINSPLADWHSWRQADTAAVARTFLREGFNLLIPRFDDLSNVQSSLYNPEGFRMVEFPAYNATFAFIYKIAPYLPIEVYGRLTTIFFSLLLILIIYYLVFKEGGRMAAFFASATFAFFPFFVYFSRVVLPDMTAVSLIFLGLILLIFSLKNKTINKIYFVLSILITSLALLIKPTVIFFFIPQAYVFFKFRGSKMFKEKKFYSFFLISFIPLLLWRLWIRGFPEGIPAASWLLTSVQTSEGQKTIFLRPSFFRWIFQERISNLILGSYLTVFLVLGLLKKPARSYLLHSIFLASFLYLFTFQGGNVQHDYYQILILPSLSIFTGLGVRFIVENKKMFLSPAISILSIFVLFVLSFFFSYNSVKNFYTYSTDLVNISKIIKTVTEKDSVIVTDTTGDTTLLYLSDRRGYPLVSEDLGKLKTRGAKYFITMNKEVSGQVKLVHQLIFESDKVYIFRLL